MCSEADVAQLGKWIKEGGAVWTDFPRESGLTSLGEVEVDGEWTDFQCSCGVLHLQTLRYAQSKGDVQPELALVSCCGVSLFSPLGPRTAAGATSMASFSVRALVLVAPLVRT